MASRYVACAERRHVATFRENSRPARTDAKRRVEQQRHRLRIRPAAFASSPYGSRRSLTMLMSISDRTPMMVGRCAFTQSWPKSML